MATKAMPAKKAVRVQALSLHIGLNSVSPAAYAGWSGPLAACEFDANDMAAIAAAALLLNYFGFVFVMTLQLVVVLIVAGRQPWLRSLIVALAAALATRYIFGELLGVPLPSSFIPGLSQWGI